jgi:AraC-like DNA-binding protein
MRRSHRGTLAGVLYVLRVRAARSPEFVRAWDPHVAGVREVFHARFVDHAYPPHTHQAWTVLIVDDGAVRYALDRHEHGSIGPTVTVLPPHVVHDGRAATTSGFAKRVVYLDPDRLGEHLIGRAVDRPTIADAALTRQVQALHGALGRTDDAFEAETRLAFVAERLAAHLAGGPGAINVLDDGARAAGCARCRAARTADAGGAGRARAGPGGAAHDRTAALRDLLDADLGARPTLAELAERVGASPTHLVRSFAARFGVPPHAYVVGRRVEAARRLLLDGRPPAEVAASVGFHDQAHLTRHFRRHVGTTPGRYRVDRRRR